MWLLSEACAREGLPHFAGGHLHGDLCRSHIAGELYDLLDGQGAMRVGVANRRAGNRHRTRRCVNDGGCLDAPGFQGQTDGERLHHRAGFKGVGQGAVTQLRATQIDTFFRVVTRVIGKGQHFTGIGIQDHNTTGLGPVVHDRITQLLVGKKLYLGINT